MSCLDEQKKLDQEAMEYHLKRKEEDDEESKQKALLRQELDACVLDRERQVSIEKQQDETDEERRNIYTNTKRVRVSK